MADTPQNTIVGDLMASLYLLGYSLFHPIETIPALGPTFNELSLGFIGESFQPDRDIPDLTGKVVLVTGGRYPAKLLWLALRARF
jgi:hypothetical protein